MPLSAARFRLIALCCVIAACAHPSSAGSARPASVAALATAESLYADLREVRDAIDVTRARGAGRTLGDTALSELTHRFAALRAPLADRVAAVDSAALAPEDQRALGMMRAALAHELGSEEPERADRGADSSSCAYDVAALLHGSGAASDLSRRMYACYGRSAMHIAIDGDTVDRLTVLGLLARTDDADKRRRLWLALDPVWRSVNGDDGPDSPYRRLVPLTARDWRAHGSPVSSAARALGVEPDDLERWLVSVLERWRDVTPATMVEPWDYYYAAGAASRRLSVHITPVELVALNERYYAALGASPAALGIHYDLAPRTGKTPVAYTTFGRRARWRDSRWVPAEPWVFATYRDGGIDNLNELLHETGHGVHIAAIRQRPAFADWPDSDPFTEGLGDLVSLEMFEPVWQQRWLGDSVPLAEAFRAKYAGIVMDIAWALFEVRVHRTPSADPNAIWTDITSRYLHITPHPERSWWAMRGQLVDSPGYMMNYALGAIIIADIRARMRALHGSFALGDSTWYGWVAPRLYVFGLARPSRQVITDFLGRPVSPGALLDDLARMGHAGSSTR